MASPVFANGRQKRLTEIAEEWGIGPLPPSPQLTKPLQPLSVRSPSDDAAAEDLLKRRRSATGADVQKSPALRRAFTTSKRKDWEPQEVFAVLDNHVLQGGSAGVAEALVVKLVSVGGDVNIANAKTKTNLITRRRSVESFERSRLLQSAVQQQNTELVAVLAPYADFHALDSGLSPAIRSGNLAIVEQLLRYGAKVANTDAAKEAFRQICSAGGHADMIQILLASDGRPPPTEVSAAMVDATKRGCLESVLYLSRSTADGSYDNGEALKQAVHASRVDIALAILTGSRPPSTACLNDTFQILFMHPNILPNEKMAFAEILLCAGASGEVLAAALNQACLNNFSEMVSLLVSYGASVEYDNGAMVRRAVLENKLSLCRILLADGVVFTPQRASACVECIPKFVTNEERFGYLLLLLRKGASGNGLSKCLIDAAEAGDVASTRILLQSHFFPDDGNTKKSSGLRHHVASADYQGGMALQLAVQTIQFEIVKLILATRPQPDTLAEVFPNIFNLAAQERYSMVQIFLDTGFSGPCVNAALQQAIQEQPPDRDEQLITLMLRSNADINASGGVGVLAAVSKGDADLLRTILTNSRPAPKTLAAALPQAVVIPDIPARHQMVFALLSAGANQDRTVVSKALVEALKMNVADAQLLHLLLTTGNADVNYKAGTPIQLAAASPDPSVLNMLLEQKSADQESLGHGMFALANLPSTDTKATKLATLLRHTKQTGNQAGTLNKLLESEVQSYVQTPLKQRVLSVIMTLLAAGADVNANNAAALCYAVAAPSTELVDLLLKAHPSPESLTMAMPRVFYISDAMDRFTLAKMLVHAGVPPFEVSRALNHAVETFPHDLPLLKLLVSAADPGESSALQSAIQQHRTDIVKTLLSSKQFSVPVLNKILAQAMEIPDKAVRQNMCEIIMASGATGGAVSSALLSAATQRDVTLGSILLANGASLEHQDGQALVEACGAGAVDFVKMLLTGSTAVRDDTLSRGFEEAAEKVADLETRTSIFRLLLERGLHGELVDKQLVVAAGCEDDGVQLARLLLEFGANVGYRGGEAVWTSTRNSCLPTLKLLLGLDNSLRTDPQQKPSQEILVRSLKAAWMLGEEDRLRVMQMLFDAGLKPTEDVHTALHKAVKEAQPSLNLIHLLLDHGASPLENGSQTFVDVVCRCQVPILQLCMATEIPQVDLDYAFKEAFVAPAADVWLSEEGLSTAKILLDKGARGDGLTTALAAAIDYCDTSKDAIARKFVQLLTQYQAHIDINIDGGLPIQAAAKLGSADLLRQLLQLKPTSDSMTRAFPYIFHANVSEEEAFGLISIFGEYRGDNGQEGIDVMFKHPGSEPVVFRAMAQYPRSVRVLQALLDAGYYHDQLMTMQLAPECGEEPVSLLFWALLQPQKKISSALIEMLIERGAKVNFETPESRMTPLMLAVQNRRADLVKLLIEADADVDVVDCWGNTPLLLSVGVGGDLGASMMSSILAADASRNDGSLHVATSRLDLKAMKLLVQHGHDVDFPSQLHGGRSALAEICLNGSRGGSLTAAKLKDMDRCISYLMAQGTDLELLADGKTALFLALDSDMPVATTQSLLRSGMYKYVNSSFNRYNDGTYTYSATMYVSNVLSVESPELRQKLLEVLRTSRTKDVFYANMGPQPVGAIGMPEDILREERERKARLDREAAEEDERLRAKRHTLELAEIAERARRDEIKAMQEKAEAETEMARKKTLAEAQAQADAVRLRADAEAQAARLKAEVEAETMQSMILRREANHQADLEHKKRLGETQLQIDGRRQKQLLEHEKKVNTERLGTAQQISSITISERRSLDKIDEAQNKRERARLNDGRLLANAINQIPPNGQGNRNVAGYIMGEVN